MRLDGLAQRAAQLGGRRGRGVGEHVVARRGGRRRAPAAAPARLAEALDADHQRVAQRRGSAPRPSSPAASSSSVKSGLPSLRAKRRVDELAAGGRRRGCRRAARRARRAVSGVERDPPRAARRARARPAAGAAGGGGAARRGGRSRRRARARSHRLRARKDEERARRAVGPVDVLERAGRCRPSRSSASRHLGAIPKLFKRPVSPPLAAGGYFARARWAWSRVCMSILRSSWTARRTCCAASAQRTSGEEPGRGGSLRRRGAPLSVLRVGSSNDGGAGGGAPPPALPVWRP